MLGLVYSTPLLNCGIIARHERAFALCFSLCFRGHHRPLFCVLKTGNLKQSGRPQRESLSRAKTITSTLHRFSIQSGAQKRV